MESVKRNVEEVMTVEEAVNLANEIERIEAALKLMKDKLKKFVEQNGALETTDKVWDFAEAVSYKFTAEQLKNVAQNIVLEGKDPWQYLGINGTSLKALGWEEAVISSMGKRTVTRRFTSRKK
ncbi:hypothetical protein [Pseudobacillus badius]|uniref:hypothetical protein n=1 Tax=Bacillus badius TaxID=1455 RepID=UPI000597C122|nr:hypothetical protein [Bacillus badius]KIL74658.1 hypothetical protein SD78_1727 [Bacillus badius]UAT32393.1 hypothetical protein K7T73_09365 [Bacillus badius]GLY12602.1 hypothetical protein Bbad01_38180 [Bacillus badius]